MQGLGDVQGGHQAEEGGAHLHSPASPAPSVLAYSSS